MDSAAVLDWSLRVVFGGGLIAIVTRAWIERRSRHASERTGAAKATVAEQTVELQVDASALANVRSEIAAMREAFDAERQSKDSVIAQKDRKIADLENDNAELHAELDQVRGQLSRIQSELDEMTARVERMRGIGPDSD